MASDPFCRACGLEHGTLWHRIAGRCSTLEDEPPWTEAEVAFLDKGKERWWDPLFSRSVAALPLTPVWPKACTWTYPPEAQRELITGHIYTDGVLRGLLLQARRSGWAFAKIDPDSLQLAVVYYGNCGGPWRSVLRAELQAIDEALMRAIAPLVIHTDSAVAITDFKKGKAYCCSAKSEGANILARIWSRLKMFEVFSC